MKCAIVDERISEKCERGLIKHGFQVIKCPPFKKLPAALSSHPDMLMAKIGNRIISSVEYCEAFPYLFSDIRELAPNTDITFCDEYISEKYPNDAIFNALTVGNLIFLKEDTASLAVKDFSKSLGLKIISVKQGYPACTVLAFGNSAITADRGMQKALAQRGINVTAINDGDISLPPHEYGFIGGASGVYKNEVYFLGDIKTHRDSDIILQAIKQENFIPISLSDEPLRDLGRIIFVY